MVETLATWYYKKISISIYKVCNLNKDTKWSPVLFNILFKWLNMYNHVANSACRSLGLLIAKSKALGGIPYDCYTYLYDTLVDSEIRYGSAVWGYHSYSPINSVQNHAGRYFLGVGKYAPNGAVLGDLGWKVSKHRQRCGPDTTTWSRINWIIRLLHGPEGWL